MKKGKICWRTAVYEQYLSGYIYTGFILGNLVWYKYSMSSVFGYSNHKKKAPHGQLLQSCFFTFVFQFDSEYHFMQINILNLQSKVDWSNYPQNKGNHSFLQQRICFWQCGAYNTSWIFTPGQMWDTSS